jgi:chorismate-pyruvate lyase
VIHATRLSGFVNRLLKRNFTAAGDWLFRHSDENAQQRGWDIVRTSHGLGRRYHDRRLAERSARHAAARRPLLTSTSTPEDAKAWARWSR